MNNEMNPNPVPKIRATAPTSVEVLRLCADIAPDLWYPSVFADQSGVDRDSLNEPVWTLVKAGLLSVAGWTKGRGQGFTVTPAGLQVLTDPNQMSEVQSLRLRPAHPRQPHHSHHSHSGHTHHDHGTDGAPLLTTYDRGERARQAFLAPRPVIVVPAILFACVVWFAAGAALTWRAGGSISNYFSAGDVRTLQRLGAISGMDLLRGEWWRLLTANFVHIGLLHLMLNMFALGVLGPIAESLWGRWRFALLYLITGIGGMAGAAAIQPQALTAGASASIWGVMVAIMIALLRNRDHLPPAEAGDLLRRFIMLITLNAVLSFLPNVSWQGHFFGGLVGLFVGVFLDWTQQGERRRRKAAGGVGVVAVIVGVIGALLAMSYSSPAWKDMRALRGRMNGLQNAFPDADALIDLNRKFNSVSPPRVQSIYQTVVISGLTPKGNAGLQARSQLHQLRSDLTGLTSKMSVFPPNLQTKLLLYLTEVQTIADLMEASLDAGRLLSDQERQKIDEHVERADVAWQALGSP